MSNYLKIFSVIAMTQFPSTTVINAQWTQSSPDLDAAAFAVDETYLLAGTNAKGIFLTDNKGESWIAVHTGLPTDPYYPSTYESVNDMVIGSENVFAAIHGKGVYHLTENANQWIAGNVGLPSNQYGNIFVYTLAASGSSLFAATEDGGVFRSTNGGNNWISTSVGLPQTPYSHVWAFAVSGTNLFASTDSGVYRTANNGQNWTKADAGLPTAGYRYIRSLAVCGTTLFAGGGGTGAYGVYRSTNNGANWTAVKTGLPPTASVAALATSGTTIFAGTEDEGLYFSTNLGASWDTLSAGLPSITALVGVSALAVCGTNLYAGMVFNILNTNTGRFEEFRSIWRYSLAPTSAHQVRKQSSPQLSVSHGDDFSMYATFFIKEYQDVKLDLYDVFGKKVVSLVNQRLGAGFHTREISTRALASGCYLMRLQSGLDIHEAKVTLIR